MSNTASVIMVEGRDTQFDKLLKSIEKANLNGLSVKESKEVLNLVKTHKPSLLLLDLQLDDRDAIDVLQELEQKGLRESLSVVVFGEQDEHYVEIAVLNAGADDYMVKPVNKRVFASRLNAWMRRQLRVDKASGDTTKNGSFNLDRERYSLLVRNEEINLQRKEFEIISLLASRPRKVFTRKEIKEIVWGDAGKARNRTIDVHITNLRSKIGPEFIKTYKGVGYSFDG